MKINKKLFPLKAHFFFNAAGISAVAPFIPIIAKHLGFSSVSVGWIQTACPIIAMFLKPFIGAFADKFKHKKSLFIFLILFSTLCSFCIQWIKPLRSDGSAVIRCEDEKFVATLCSLALKEQTYKDHIHSLRLPQTCKVSLQKSGTYIIGSPQSTTSDSTGAELETDAFVNLENIIKIEGGCGTLTVAFLNLSISASISSMCRDGLVQVGLECSEPFLDSLLRKPLVSDLSILSKNQFWLLLVLAVGNYAGFSISNSLGDAIAFTVLGKKPENYGMQRVWGSIGWGIFSVISGLVVDKLSEGKSETDYTSAFYIMLFLILIDCLITSKIQIKILHKSESIKKDVKRIFQNPQVIIFAVWCFLIGILFSFIWNFLFWFIEELAMKSGKNKSWIRTLEGLVQAMQCLAEGPLIFFSGNIIKQIGYTNAMTIVLFGFSARLLFYTILSNPWWALPIEIFNGITFGMFYPTMTSYASFISPPGSEATVQNVFSSLYEGAGTAVGSFIGGYLVEYLGVSRTFLVVGIAAALLAFIHMIVQYLIKETQLKEDAKLQPQEEQMSLKEEILQI